MTLTALALTMAVATTTANTDPGWGVFTAEISTSAGKISLYMPDDMAAGDMVSGSVFAEGRYAPTEVVIDGERAPIRRSMFTIKLPESTRDSATVEIESEGGDAVKLIVPLKEWAPSPALRVPRVTMSGMPMKIEGPFDGDRRNTMAELDGRSAGILAESPRSCALLAPTGWTGPYKVEMLEDRAHIEGQLHNVAVHLNMPEQVTVGRMATVEVEVQGLDGLSAEALPFTVVVASTHNVVEFDRKTTDRAVVDSGSEIVDGTFRKKIHFRSKKKGSVGLVPRLISQ